MMSSCCTFRLKRRRAFSSDSPSCSRTSANLITSQPATNHAHLSCALRTKAAKVDMEVAWVQTPFISNDLASGVAAAEVLRRALTCQLCTVASAYPASSSSSKIACGVDPTTATFLRYCSRPVLSKRSGADTSPECAVRTTLYFPSGSREKES
jgi:hypothetical protein